MKNRDTHEGMPEILDAFQENGERFGVIAITLNGTTKKFRFGVSYKGYVTLKNILQLRPFDMMPGLKQRYFFAGASYRIVDRETPELDDFEVGIRVEQNKTRKTISLKAAKDLARNLIWFEELKDFSETAHLPEVE